MRRSLAQAKINVGITSVSCRYDVGAASVREVPAC
jgi:hypothetical protein